jgi:hypothetical protein
MSASLVVNASKHIESLLIVLSLDYLLMSEFPITQPHGSACLQPVAPIHVIIMILVENCIHCVHLSETNHGFICRLVVWEVLIIYSVSFPVYFIVHIYLMQ